MKPFRYYMRALHRDLGYFVIGLVVIYALSGIILMYRNTDFLKKEVIVENQLAPGMNGAALNDALRLRGFQITKEDANQILFNTGRYDKQTGVVRYSSPQIIAPFNRFIDLHKIISSRPIHWLMVAFGIILFFLAVSSFWMFKPGTRLFRRGLVIAVLGGACAVGILFLI